MRRQFAHVVTMSLMINLFGLFGIQAFEIEIFGKAASKSGSTNVGLIDMQEVYSTFPETKRAKNDFSLKVFERQREIKAREEEISKLLSEVALLQKLQNSTTAQADVASQPDKAGAVEQINEKEQEISKKEEELDQYRKESEQTLLKLESHKTQQLLSKVYRVIEEVAQENRITVVIDKDSIIYGEKGMDLTETVIKKLRQ